MIVSMYGHCDDFDVVYAKTDNNLWQTNIPADLSDGKYVVEIYGVDNTGYIAYWTGILYMYDSRVVRLELLEDSYGMFWTDAISDVWDSSDIVDVRVSQALSPNCH